MTPEDLDFAARLKHIVPEWVTIWTVILGFLAFLAFAVWYTHRAPECPPGHVALVNNGRWVCVVGIEP